jgi:glycosyltransferase involved in cell wall biosynthesis
MQAAPLISASASVVIPTYNRRTTLARTLEGLLQQTARDPFEIIVVDDCSSDDTPEYMHALRGSHPRIVYLRHTENAGRVVTRNDGIKIAHGDVIILLDDDNLPNAGFVDAHLRIHAGAGAERVAVMGNVRFASDCIAGSNFGRFLQSRYLGCRSPSDRAGIDYADLPSRCFGTLNCSVRRSDLVAVGLFDPRFRYYGGEDEDMGHALRRSGVRIVFGEEARTAHHDEVSLERYKSKLTELAHYGLAVAQTKNPEYIETTQMVYLLPIERNDSALRRARKLLFSILCNRPVNVMLEWWARRTEGIPWLYSQSPYRLLTASWLYQGYRSKGIPDLRVEYGDSNQRTDSRPG